MTNYLIESPVVSGCFPSKGIGNNFVTSSAVEFAARYRVQCERGLPRRAP